VIMCHTMKVYEQVSGQSASCPWDKGPGTHWVGLVVCVDIVERGDESHIPVADWLSLTTKVRT
jgi:hypothetical protein